MAKEPVSKTGTAERPSGFESPSLRQGVCCSPPASVRTQLSWMSSSWMRLSKLSRRLRNGPWASFSSVSFSI